MIRNILFDWSGTLVNDRPAVLATTNAILTHFNREPLSSEEFALHFKLPYTEFYEAILPEPPLEELQRRYLEVFTVIEKELPIHLLPHAGEALAHLREKGIQLGILSSAPSGHLREQAKFNGVENFFAEWHGGVLDKRKYLKNLIKEKGWNPSETAFIGDMLHDLEAGKEAGVLSVAVGTGYDSAEKLLSAEPDLFLPNLSSLPRWIHGPIPSHLPISTVGALLVNESGKVLLVRTHKWKNRWGIPGGKIHRGETAEEALCREVFEETGLEISETRWVMLQDCVNPPEYERSAHFLLLNYWAKVQNGEVVLNDEAEDFAWVSPNEITHYDLNQPTRILVQEIEKRGWI